MMRNTRTHPRALRERVVRAVEAGASCRQVAARFDVGVSSAIKWCALFRATGDVEPKKRGGHRPRILDSHQDWVKALFEETPHMTVVQLQQALHERGVVVSHDTVWRYIRHLGFSFKQKSIRG